MKRGAIICRVSTDQQDTLRQVEELKEYAKQSGFIVAKNDVYEDKISGYSKKENRPQLNRFFSNVDKGEKYDAVFFSEVTRVARKPIEGHNIIHKISEEYGIPVYIKQQNICSIDNQGQRDIRFFAMLGMLLEFGNYEAMLFKSRSSSGLLTSAKKGRYGGGRLLPYGYKRSADKMLIIDEDEAVIVRRIFKLVLDGLGGKRIASILNKEKIPTRVNKAFPGGQFKFKDESRMPINADEVKWTDGYLQSLIQNPIYVGRRRYKGQILEAPAIIPEKLWNQVQEIRSDRFNKKVKETKYHFVLQRLVKCGICTKFYVGRYKESGKEEYYQCGSTRYKSCGNRAISISKLDGVIWAMVAKTPYVQNLLILTSENRQRLQGQQDTLKLKLVEDYDAHALAVKKLNRLREMYLNEKIDEEYFDAQRNKLTTQINTYKAHIDKFEQEIRSIDESISSLHKAGNIRRAIRETQDDPFKVSRILHEILSHIVIVSENSDRNCARFLITIFLRHVTDQVSFVYNKETNEALVQPIFDSLNKLDKSEQSHLQKLIGHQPKFDQYGHLIGDAAEIIRKFVSSSGRPIIGPIIIRPDIIPFQKINILDSTKARKSNTKKK